MKKHRSGLIAMAILAARASLPGWSALKPMLRQAGDLDDGADARGQAAILPQPCSRFLRGLGWLACLIHHLYILFTNVLHSSTPCLNFVSLSASSTPPPPLTSAFYY